MKKSIKVMLAGLLAVPMLTLGISVAVPVTASAEGTCVTDPSSSDLSLKNGAACAKGQDQSSDLFGPTGIFKQITNAALYLVGAISVIMLIYGGIRYTISGGETSNVTAAKNTILYAVVGIVVSLLAYAIVNFVIGALPGTA